MSPWISRMTCRAAYQISPMGRNPATLCFLRLRSMTLGTRALAASAAI